ncbi:hypothetical protein [Flavivirga spongiicola]|uniref:T9SS type A sorting domain-containing protein n=1 Tax=Flavivirga spongiicola TaxID=421621 RepID=A0ABU7XQA2_9FLAO|nr:hypothetical protein [Flavivirga sp. MEBiC05379]MDO5977959.1 hypothetical protein [Flavivirga sp. MEBiC05379]
MKTKNKLQINFTYSRYNLRIKNPLDLYNEIVFYKRRNKEIEKNLQILKKRKATFELLFSVLIWISLIGVLTSTKVHAQFKPKDVSDLVFFVESANISESHHVATCESDFCLNHPNSESAIITEQYCDVSNSCGEGCVRRWLDQSDYMPSGGFNPPEYTSGRNFGQDDKEKPCYISNCINGKPCMRGGPAYGDDGMGNYKFKQDKYLEIEGADAISLTGAFSVFLLAKPADQTTTGDWSYFGLGAHYVTHKVSNNTIKLRVGNTVPPSPVVTITTPNAVLLNQWQLIEIHRDVSGNITSFINGVDTSVAGANSGIGTFKIGYLLSNFKTEASHGIVSMHGDVASFLIYNKKTSDSENINLRAYFDVNYLGNVLNTKRISSINMQIFPNPVQDYLELKIKKSKNFLDTSSEAYPVIYNVLGEEVSTSIEKTEKGDLISFYIQFNDNINSGFYFVNFGGDIVKLIKT